jgi:hypothetical protein
MMMGDLSQGLFFTLSVAVQIVCTIYAVHGREGRLQSDTT